MPAVETRLTLHPALDRPYAAIADQRRQADEWSKPSALISLETVRALDDLFCRELFETRRRSPNGAEALRKILTWGGNQPRSQGRAAVRASE